MMTKIRPYSSVFIALLLLAGPWLPAHEISTAEEMTFCECCNGPCQGCCCSMPENDKPANNGDKEDGCSCQISDMPAIPEQPLELPYQRNDIQPNHIMLSTNESFGDAIQICEKTEISGISPPESTSRPLYVLFNSFLI